MNWKEEAVEKLQRYAVMSNALRVIPLELQRLELEATAISSGGMGGGSKSRSLQAREDLLLSIMVRKQELEHNRRNAQLWIDFLDLGLAQLEEEDRVILQRLYIDRDRDVLGLCAELGLEKTSLYRHREAALKRLTLALYGALES